MTAVVVLFGTLSVVVAVVAVVVAVVVLVEMAGTTQWSDLRVVSPLKICC